MKTKLTLHELNVISQFLNIPQNADVFDICTGIKTAYPNLPTLEDILADIKAKHITFRLNDNNNNTLIGAIYYYDGTNEALTLIH